MKHYHYTWKQTRKPLPPRKKHEDPIAYVERRYKETYDDLDGLEGILEAVFFRRPPEDLDHWLLWSYAALAVIDLGYNPFNRLQRKNIRKREEDESKRPDQTTAGC